MTRLLISTAIVGLAAMPTFAIAQSDQGSGSGAQTQTESQTDMGTGTQADMQDGSQTETDMDAGGSADSSSGDTMTDTGGSAGSSTDTETSGMTSGSGDGASGDKAPVSEGHSAVDPDTVEASEIEGAQVMSRDDEEFGEVSEVLLTEDGAIEAIVVNVGGVLGIGSKPVEVPFDRVTLQTSDDGGEMSVVIPMSEQELEDMPRYEDE